MPASKHLPVGLIDEQATHTHTHFAWKIPGITSKLEKLHVQKSEQPLYIPTEVFRDLK